MEKFAVHYTLISLSLSRSLTHLLTHSFGSFYLGINLKIKRKTRSARRSHALNIEFAFESGKGIWSFKKRAHTQTRKHKRNEKYRRRCRCRATNKYEVGKKESTNNRIVYFSVCAPCASG